jgi:hypothetical protein
MGNFGSLPESFGQVKIFFGKFFSGEFYDWFSSVFCMAI